MFVPVVFWVASTERDVLHLEEVTTSVKLEEKKGITHPKKELLFVSQSVR